MDSESEEMEMELVSSSNEESVIVSVIDICFSLLYSLTRVKPKLVPKSSISCFQLTGRKTKAKTTKGSKSKAKKEGGKKNTS